VPDDITSWPSSRGGAAWGAIAQSNNSGLRYRDPVYRTLRELVMSYFPHYYNLQGEKNPSAAFSTPPSPGALRTVRLG